MKCNNIDANIIGLTTIYQQKGCEFNEQEKVAL